MTGPDNVVKVLRVNASDGGGIVTVMCSPAGATLMWGSDGGEVLVVPVVSIQAEMVMLTTPAECRAIAMFMKRAADWLEERVEDE